LVKDVTNVTLGGWLRSEANSSELMRRDWSDMIISEATVRAWVHVERACAAGVPAVGMRRDAVWFVRDQPFVPPVGIPVDTTNSPNGRNGELGSFKLSRSAKIGPHLLGAVSTGSPEMLVRALVADAKGKELVREFGGLDADR
jgi:hypothetical protein